MISPLHIGLIALAAVFILGLLVVNWWQERAIRRDMDQRFDGPIDDVLMGRSAEVEATTIPAFYEEEAQPEPEFVFPEENEPEFTVSDDIELADNVLPTSKDLPESKPESILEAPPKVVPEPEPEIESEIELEPVPVLPENDAEIVQEEIPKFVSSPIPAIPPALDNQIDAIFTFIPNTPCLGGDIRKQLNPQAEYGKTARWYGVADARWVPLTREHEHAVFERIVGALQMVDRGGALQAEGWLAFQAQAEQLSEAIGGTLEWQEEREALTYAKALDEFCIEVDLMMTLHLTAGIEGPFAGTKMRGLAEASGLILKEDGRFHLINEGGETLYMLADASQRPMREESLRTAMLYDLVLMLDVPRIANGDNVFRQMAVFGDRLESALRAKLTDAHQRPVGEAGIEAIRKQIQAIYAKMRDRGIAPGSPTALRLFS